MMAKPRKSKAKPKEAASGGAETSRRPGNEVGEGVRHLAEARDDGAREATIATFAECVKMAKDRAEAYHAEDNHQWACAVESMIEDYLLELRRRYANHLERIAHHLDLQGIT